MSTPIALTEEGLSRGHLPSAMLKELQAFQSQQPIKEEVVEGFITNDAAVTPSVLQPLTPQWITKLHRYFQTACETWANKALVPTYVYGIRTYHRGTTLKMHRDRDDTHIVSIIVNINQQVDEPWPLSIEGATPQDTYRDAYLLPGEILFYEGNRLKHGRPTPLKGESFSNLFVHYRLA